MKKRLLCLLLVLVTALALCVSAAAAAQTGAPEVPENAGYGEMDAKAFRFSAAGELEV